MPTSNTTKNHDEIRKWADARNAVPCEVEGSERGDEPGILRFEFPQARNRNDAKLREIPWEEFFSKFDENNLELLYEEKTADGQVSNFNKLIHPESEKSRGSHKGRAAALKTSDTARIARTGPPSNQGQCEEGAYTW